jgi:hypothetical protein
MSRFSPGRGFRPADPSIRHTGSQGLDLGRARFFRSLIGWGGFNNLILPTYAFRVAASVTALLGSKVISPPCAGRSSGFARPFFFAILSLPPIDD